MISGFYEVLKLITSSIGSETFTKKELVSVTGLSERSVERHLANLISNGFVKVVVYRKKSGESEYCLSDFGDVNEFVNNVFRNL